MKISQKRQLSSLALVIYSFLLSACMNQASNQEDVSQAGSSSKSHFQETVPSNIETLAAITQLKNKQKIMDSDIEGMSPSQLIEESLDQIELPEEALSLYYYRFDTEESYTLNESRFLPAASTYKVGLAMLAIQEIQAGNLEWDTIIPYSQDLWEDGHGNITHTNSVQEYTLSQVMDEMIINSDNTATNMLIMHLRNRGINDRLGILQLSGLTDYPPEALDKALLSAEANGRLLKELAENDLYQPLVKRMLVADGRIMLNRYINYMDMASKFGRLGDALHHMGIYYDQEDKPAYLLVVMTQANQEETEDWLAELNLQLAFQYYLNP